MNSKILSLLVFFCCCITTIFGQSKLDSIIIVQCDTIGQYISRLHKANHEIHESLMNGFDSSFTSDTRSALIEDLLVIAERAQQFYRKPIIYGGGGNTYSKLTADSVGMAILVVPEFSNNVVGNYTITKAGNKDSVVFQGVGKHKYFGSNPKISVTVKPKHCIITCTK